MHNICRLYPLKVQWLEHASPAETHHFAYGVYTYMLRMIITLYKDSLTKQN